MLKTWIGVSLTSVMLLGGGASVVTAADMGDSALRTTVENMNGTLGWASDAQQITVDIAGSKAMLKLGSVDATIKGQTVKLDKAPYLVMVLHKCLPPQLHR